MSHLMHARDLIVSQDVCVRWDTQFSDGEQQTTEQVVKTDDLGRLYMSELKPNPSADVTNFAITDILRETGKGFFYVHLYDGQLTTTLSIREAMRSVFVFDGNIESAFTRKNRTVISITIDDAINGLSRQPVQPTISDRDSVKRLVFSTDHGETAFEVELDRHQGLMPTRIYHRYELGSVETRAEYRQTNDVWFPVTGTREYCNATGKRTARWSFAVQSISINETIPDNVFAFEVPDDVIINDARFGCSWKHHEGSQMGSPLPQAAFDVEVARKTTWVSAVPWAMGGVMFAILLTSAMRMAYPYRQYKESQGRFAGRAILRAP